VAKPKGRLELTWTDKDKCLVSVADGKYDYSFAEPDDPRVVEIRLLREVDHYANSSSSLDDAGLPGPFTDNVLITGDAMHALEALRKTPEWAAKYRGKIKMAYMDPPFNTGQAFSNYDDNIEHSIWLTMIRDRVRQIRDLLSEDGTLWVHLDDVEAHRCRLILDEELGEGNFLASITWEKLYARKSNNKSFSPNHDVILVYGMSAQSRLKKLAATDEVLARYKNPDNDPRGPWQSVSFSVRTDDPAKRGEYRYEVELPSGRMVTPPKGRHWNGKKARFIDLVAEGLIWFGAKGDSLPRYKHFVEPDDIGLVPQTIWTRLEVGDNDVAKKDLKRLFPDKEDVFDTPKPELLLERIIQLATEPGDTVLDCFGGSGTTAAVAHKMRRRWITSELVPKTVSEFIIPRLKLVIEGLDGGGISSKTTRLAADDVTLPFGIDASEAHQFNRLLRKIVADSEFDLDVETLSNLKAATKTVSTAKRSWFDGGGFTHYEVQASMYDIDPSGDVFLSSEAHSDNWKRALAAQLGFTYISDDTVFSGARGKQKLAVVDGVVDEVVVRAVVEHLAYGERAIIIGKIVLPAASRLIGDLSPGSRLRKAPGEVFTRRTVR
jgi:adenine-specific DNA-methyltransferase